MISDISCIAGSKFDFLQAIDLRPPEALWFHTLQELVCLVHNLNGAGLQGLCRLVLLCARIILRYPVM